MLELRATLDARIHNNLAARMGISGKTSALSQPHLGRLFLPLV
jgi:hypothetical protein